MRKSPHYSTRFLPKFVTALLLLFTSIQSNALTISSTTSGGDWNVGTTWVGGVVPGPGDNVIIVAGSTVSLLSGSPTNQTGGATLTINGTLSLGTSGSPYKNTNYTLGGFSAIAMSGTGSQIYWNGNNTLSFAAGTTFSIASNSSGCQPTGGSASSSLVIGSTTIAVSSTNANNAAYSFSDFNIQGGLPTFTMTVSPVSGSCGANPVSVTVTPSATGVNPFTYTFSISPTTPALASGFSPSTVTTSGGTTTQFTPANSTVTYTITCAVTATGDPLATKTALYTITAGTTITVGGAIAAICQSGTTTSLNGSYSGGGATGAIWSDGSAGGSFANNTGSSPNTATYTAAANAPSTVTLTLTNTGGTCTASASKTITVNPKPSAAGSITGAATVCQGQTGVTYSVPAITNATGYVWSLPTGATITSGNGTNSITVSYASTAASGNVNVYGTNGCGNGTASANYAVTVNLLPTVNAGGAVLAICQGGTTAALGGSFGGGATAAVWSDGGAGGTFTSNTGSTPGTATYGASASAPSSVTLTLTTSGGSCSTVFASKTLTVNPVSATTAYWTGTVNTDWCNAGNWSCGVIPSATLDAVIVAGSPNYPNATCANVFVHDITVQPGASITISSGIDIYGAITNTDPTRYTLNGTVTFAGTNQSIPAFTYKGLAISGGGTKTLAGAVSVTGNMNLVNGIVDASTNALTIAPSGSMSAGSSSSYVIGSVTRQTNTAGTLLFSVGGNGNLHPVSVEVLNAGFSEYTVRYYPAATSGTIGSVQLFGLLSNEYWQITRITGSDAIPSIYYTVPNGLASGAASSDWTTGVNPCAACNVSLVEQCSVWYCSGDDCITGTPFPGGWSATESAHWQTSGYLAARRALTATNSSAVFSFGFGYLVVLPITLESFTARAEGSDARLQWTLHTGNESVNVQLQHTIDGRNFQSLQEIKAATSGSYAFTHPSLTEGAHYYRLKLVDKTGKTAYSKLLLVSMGKSATTIRGLRPTMVQGAAWLDVLSAKTQWLRYQLMDATGRVMAEQKTMLQGGENNIRLLLPALVPGMYMVKAQTEDGATGTVRFVKE